jgi:hypothetical protein
MESSVLKSVKKLLGVTPEYTAFDLDILTHINSVFSSLKQLGIAQDVTIVVEDDGFTWDQLNLSSEQLNWVKTYVYLKVRYLFDPPATSFGIEALEKQITEHEWRLNVDRENLIPLPTPDPVLQEPVW